jgi:hypothetical protein
MNEDSNDYFPYLDGTMYIISYSYTDGDSTVTDYAYKDVRNVNAGSTVSCDIDGLLAATEYTIKVRVANDSPIQSRWSNGAKVKTGAYLYAPLPISPVQGQPQAATTSLNPTFTWATVVTAVSYEFQLSDSATFANLIDSQALNANGYTYLGDGLDYDTDYYWRVRAVGADGTKSAWSSFGVGYISEDWWDYSLSWTYFQLGAPTVFHTMVDPEEYQSELTITQTIPTITITQTQTNPTYTIPVPEFTVTVPAAQTTVTTQTHTITIPDEKTPAYIWAIVAIGALLTIAVIVLIIRTRRVV